MVYLSSLSFYISPSITLFQNFDLLSQKPLFNLSYERRISLNPLLSYRNLISLELYHTFQELTSISVLPSLFSPPQCYIFALSIPTTRLNALTEPQLEYTSCPLFPPSPFIFSSSFTIFLPLSSPSLLSVPCLPYLPSPPHTMHHANRSEEPPRGGKRNWREEKR